ncbi:MAG: DinB family protein [Aggregatilineales bacterium]
MSDRTQEMLTELERQRAALLGVLRRLTPAQWETPVQDGDSHWTARQMVAHLSDAERGMVGQATRIAAGEEPIPPDFDLSRWNKRAVEKLNEKSSAELLQSLTESRVRLKEALAKLTDADLDKVGRHSSLQMMTVEAIFRLIGTHEFNHATIIASALKLPAPHV